MTMPTVVTCSSVDSPDLAAGLTEEQAARQLQRSGRNELLTKKPPSILALLLRQLTYIQPLHRDIWVDLALVAPIEVVQPAAGTKHHQNQQAQ